MLGGLQRSVNIPVSFAFFTGIKVAGFKAELRSRGHEFCIGYGLDLIGFKERGRSQ